jgi:hypothetical protein
MLIARLAATDAGGKSRPHRAYEAPLTLLSLAWLLRACGQGGRERSRGTTRTRQSLG